MDQVKSFVRKLEVESYSRTLRPVEQMVFDTACKLVDGAIKASPRNMARILSDIRMVAGR